ncbi:MAG: mRNA surveillance protein pelota [Candidatus Anstonellales archaeon]
MKILNEDKKHGIIKIKIESAQDLWYLSKILNAHDILSGQSFRAVKFNGEEERKPIFVKIEAEKIDFKQRPISLRVTGIIIDGKPEEFIQRGKHHSIEITEDYVLTIEKKEWRDYEINVIKNALEDSRRKAAQLLLIDERKALIIDITPYGFEEKFEIDLPAGKKWDEKEIERIKEKKYKEIIQSLDKQAIIIIAGPGFEKEKANEIIKNNGYKTKIADASYAEVSSIKELLDAGIIDSVIGEARLIKEAKLVNETLLSIYKNDGLAVYGKENIKKAIDYNAISYIIVIDKLLADNEIKNLLKEAEQKNKAKIHIISTSHEWGEKLKGMKGIAAMLRFKIEG